MWYLAVISGGNHSPPVMSQIHPGTARAIDLEFSRCQPLVFAILQGRKTSVGERKGLDLCCSASRLCRQSLSAPGTARASESELGPTWRGLGGPGQVGRKGDMSLILLGAGQRLHTAAHTPGRAVQGQDCSGPRTLGEGSPGLPRVLLLGWTCFT